MTKNGKTYTKIKFKHDWNTYELEVGQVGNSFHGHSRVVKKIVESSDLYLLTRPKVV